MPVDICAGNKMGNEDDLCGCVPHGEGQRGPTGGMVRGKGHCCEGGAVWECRKCPTAGMLPRKNVHFRHGVKVCGSVRTFII